MKKLAILHYLPIEYYPPATNLLDYLVHMKNQDVRVWTCRNTKNRKEYHRPALKISRVSSPNQLEPAPLRLLKYWHFNLRTLAGLVIFNPALVMYYESYSAWPAYMYLRYFNRKAKLYIHFHEYYDRDWYRRFMRLVRYYHSLEKAFLFQRANWISQTNAFRNELFLKDHPALANSKIHILSNFPPLNWRIRERDRSRNPQEPIRFVYIGSLSLEATYLIEFCDWLNGQQGKATFDIYSYNIYDSAKQYIESLGNPDITLHTQGMEYKRIPEVIIQYDVGVIFYKPYSDNVVYCVSNKFYEYLACGIDIWFSEAMKATWPLEDRNGNPRITKVDFETLDNIKLEDISAPENQLSKKDYNYNCETEYQKLLDHF